MKTYIVKQTGEHRFVITNDAVPTDYSTCGGLQSLVKAILWLTSLGHKVVGTPKEVAK